MRPLFCSAAVLFLTVVMGSGQEDELRKRFTSDDREVRREAAVKIRKMGAKARVYLPELIRALDDPDKQVWFNAIEAISTIGPDAAEAIPLLIKDMDSRKKRGRRAADLRQAVYRNAYALGCIGVASVPPLIEALRSEDVMTRQGAAKALEYIGDKGRDAIPALSENLAHWHAELRADAINALSVIALKSDDRILGLLDSQVTLERQGALVILGKMGATAGDTAARLFQMTESENEPEVRATLFETLVSIKAEQKRLIPLLIAGIQDGNPAIRRAAVNSLLLIDPDGGRVIPTMIVSLQSTDPAVRQNAAHVAGCYGEVAAKAVPALIVMVEDKADSQFAINALARIGAPAVREILRKAGSSDPMLITREHWAISCIAKMGAAATPELIKGMEDKNVAIRLLSVLGCIVIRIEAAPATDALVKLAGDSDPRVRSAVFEALAVAEVDAGRFLPLIELAMKDSNPVVQMSAMAQIPYLKEDGKPLASSLLAMMSEGSPEIRKAAVQAVSSNMDETIPPLIKCVEDEILRKDAIKSLGRFGSRAKEAVSALVGILPGSDKETRHCIISALALIGSEDVITPLAGALKDEDAECRAAAVAAYLKVERDPAVKLSVALSMLEDSEVNVRQSAAEALSLVGDRAKEATPQLVKMLQADTDREFAIETMRRISVNSIPHLIEILSDSHESARLFAVQRLGQIGATAGDAVPALKTLSQDNKQPEIIRGEAQHALRRIGR